MKRTRLLSFVLVVIMIFSSLTFASVSAEQSESEILTETHDYGVFNYKMYTENSVMITEYISYSEEKLVIPSKINGFTVAAIGEKAFKHSWPSEIILPDTLEYIGDYAFESSQIKTLKIPAKVKEIGYAIFYCADKLISFTVDKNNKYYKTVDGVLFSKDGKTLCEYPNMKEGRKYTVPSGVEYIRDYAFYGNYYLEEITLSEGVREIGVRAFSECLRLGTAQWPTTLEIIDEYAYADSARFYKIQGYDSFYYVAPNAFENTKWYDNQPRGCIYLGGLLYSYKFSHTVPCYETTSEQANRIGPYAFADWGPTELTISANILYIDPTAFHGAYNLEKIIVDENNPYYASVDGMLYDKEKKILISAAPGRDGVVSIPEGTEYIHDEAFFGARADEINIPSSVYYIGEGAFQGCDIKKLNISEGVEYIGASAFKNCHSLEEIILPESAIPFGEGIFDGCEKVTDVVVPFGSVLYNAKDFESTSWYRKKLYNKAVVSNGAVLGYKGLIKEDTVVEIPEGAVSIGFMAFADKEKLTQVVFPESLKRIGACAFENCPNLKEVTIPASMDEIYPFSLGYTFVEGETKEDGEHFSVEGFTIKGYTNSKAEEYALENDFEFVSVGILKVSELLGDADLNGVINIKDATAIQKYVASMKCFVYKQKLNSDMNHDGEINVKDATAIQKKLAGLPY